MWNLFSTDEPKIAILSGTLKQQLLRQQFKCLELIKERVQLMNSSIKFVLKQNRIYEKQFQKEHKRLIEKVESITESIYNLIKAESNNFQNYIIFRDQQKNNQQKFFKETMKLYEIKKSELNHYIEQLQNKVQALELQGMMTYDLNPKANNVINGINAIYLNKYLMKDEEQKKIEQILEQIEKKSQQKSIKNQFAVSASDKQAKKTLIDTRTKCLSLIDLENQLQFVLLKQEIVEQMLDKKIKNCKKKFQKFAFQEHTLKESLKKLSTKIEDKKRSSDKIATANRLSQADLIRGLPVKKSVSNLRKKNQIITDFQDVCPSIDNYSQQNELSRNSEQISLDSKEQIQKDLISEQSSRLIPSQNFIEACQFLITERFIEDNKENSDRLKIEDSSHS